MLTTDKFPLDFGFSPKIETTQAYKLKPLEPFLMNLLETEPRTSILRHFHTLVQYLSTTVALD